MTQIFTGPMPFVQEEMARMRKLHVLASISRPIRVLGSLLPDHMLNRQSEKVKMVLWFLAAALVAKGKPILSLSSYNIAI